MEKEIKDLEEELRLTKLGIEGGEATLKHFKKELERVETSQENDKIKAEKLEKQIAELKAETPKRWRVERGNNYFYIDSLCNIEEDIDTITAYDNSRYEIGNYFKTREQAEQKIEHLKIEQQLKDIALRLNNGVEIDWGNYDQEKWFLGYDFGRKIIEDDYFNTTKYQGIIYCINDNFKDIAIAEIGEERLKNYLKEA